MTTTLTSQTDKAKVTAAFKALRRRGFIARQNYKCCGSCAGYALAERVKEDVLNGGELPVNGVYYHQQDNDAFGRDGNLTSTLYLRHGIDVILDPDLKPPLEYVSNPESTGVIVEALRKQGLDAEWTGDMGRCIEVKPRG